MNSDNLGSQTNRQLVNWQIYAGIIFLKKSIYEYKSMVLYKPNLKSQENSDGNRNTVEAKFKIKLKYDQMKPE